MEIKGQIDEIVYTNEENGYTVCSVELEDETLITAVRLHAFYICR